MKKLFVWILPFFALFLCFHSEVAANREVAANAYERINVIELQGITFRIPEKFIYRRSVLSFINKPDGIIRLRVYWPELTPKSETPAGKMYTRINENEYGLKISQLENRIDISINRQNLNAKEKIQVDASKSIYPRIIKAYKKYLSEVSPGVFKLDVKQYFLDKQTNQETFSKYDENRPPLIGAMPKAREFFIFYIPTKNRAGQITCGAIDVYCSVHAQYGEYAKGAYSIPIVHVNEFAENFLEMDGKITNLVTGFVVEK